MAVGSIGTRRQVPTANATGGQTFPANGVGSAEGQQGPMGKEIWALGEAL